LIPLSLLPYWIHPLSWVLAPTWGMRAMRRAAIGGSVGMPLAVCALLTIAYAVLAFVLLHHFERLARERATLSLS
jgi:ABC-2 type transport system permease protein